MKFRTYETKSLAALVGVLLLAFGMFVGYAATENEMSKKIEVIEADAKIVYDQMISYESELSATIEELNAANAELDVANKSLVSAHRDNESLQDALNAANATIEDLKSDEYELVYIGTYKLTHYCTEKRAHICGTGNGITATGTKVTAGRTIAVDPSVIPYGTKVYIEGYGWRVAEDCGGAVDGKHIDMAVDTHSQAISMGTKTSGVWMLVKKSA